MSILRSKRRRTPTRFERWATTEIQSYRVGLTGMYCFMTYFGTQSLIAGVPAFNIAAPQGFTAWWAPVVVVGAIVAAIGSLTDSKRFVLTETIGAWLLFLALATYSLTLLALAYGTGDQSRAAVGSMAVALGVVPFVRLIWLMFQLGRKRAPIVHVHPEFLDPDPNSGTPTPPASELPVSEVKSVPVN